MRRPAGYRKRPRGTSMGAAFLVAILAPLPHGATAGSLEDVAFADLEPIDFYAAPLLTRDLRLTGFEGPKAVLEFETREPTPPAVVRYGPYFAVGGIEGAAYRKVATERLEDESATEHRVLVDFSKLESPLYDDGYIEGGGGVVACRLDVYDPEYGSVRTYDRRFRYTRTGPRKTAETMVLGPFVDRVGPTSFVVSWQTDVPSRGAVVLEGVTFVGGKEAVVHEVEVADLEPGTTYEYRVRYGSDDFTTRPHAVTTAPAPGGEGFRFAFASDSRGGVGGGEHAIEGVNHAGLRAVLAGARTRGADLVLFGGDLIDGYTSSQRVFESQLDSWKRGAGVVASSLPIYEGMGNHEEVGDYYAVDDPERPNKRIIMHRDRAGARSAEAIFSRSFVNPEGSCYGFSPRPETRETAAGPATGPDYGESVYSFNHGNCHFVSVNSNYWFTGLQMGDGTTRYPSDKDGTALALGILAGNREGYLLPGQLAWLEEDLKAAQQDDDVDWIFVFTHEPAFPNGGHLYDAMFWGEAGKGFEGGLNDHDVPLGDVLDMRDRFWSILARNDKVVALMCGDEHNYSRTLIDADVDPSYSRAVWQIVSGGSGAPFYVQDTSVPWAGSVHAFSPVNHYCLFDVRDGRVSLEVYSTDGVLLDSLEGLTEHARDPGGR